MPSDFCPHSGGLGSGLQDLAPFSAVWLDRSPLPQTAPMVWGGCWENKSVPVTRTFLEE